MVSSTLLDDEQAVKLTRGLLHRHSSANNCKRAIQQTRCTDSSNGSADNQHVGRHGYCGQERAEFEDCDEDDICKLGEGELMFDLKWTGRQLIDLGGELVVDAA